MVGGKIIQIVPWSNDPGSQGFGGSRGFGTFLALDDRGIVWAVEVDDDEDPPAVLGWRVLVQSPLAGPEPTRVPEERPAYQSPSDAVTG